MIYLKMRRVFLYLDQVRGEVNLPLRIRRRNFDERNLLADDENRVGLADEVIDAAPNHHEVVVGYAVLENRATIHPVFQRLKYLLSYGSAQ